MFPILCFMYSVHDPILSQSNYYRYCMVLQPVPVTDSQQLRVAVGNFLSKDRVHQRSIKFIVIYGILCSHDPNFMPDLIVSFVARITKQLVYN